MFMVYSALGGDILTPMAVPAILFYPALEFGFQKAAVQYERFLKSIPNVYGRLAVRSAICFACIGVHVALLSTVGVAEFGLLTITISALKSAVIYLV